MTDLNLDRLEELTYEDWVEVNGDVIDQRRGVEVLLARVRELEATAERVRAVIIRAGTYGPDEFWAFKRDLALAALGAAAPDAATGALSES